MQAWFPTREPIRGLFPVGAGAHFPCSEQFPILLHYTFSTYFALRLQACGWPILFHSLHILHSISFAQITPPNLSLVRNVRGQIASFSWATVSTVKQQWYFYRFSKRRQFSKDSLLLLITEGTSQNLCPYHSQTDVWKRQNLTCYFPA